MKRLGLLLCFLLCLPLTARADEASRRVKAQEMVALLHMDTLMQQMMDIMQKQMSTNLRQLCACDKTETQQQQALLDDFTKKAFTLVESRMGWKAIEPEILDLYARTFTDEELDGMLAFYKSPAGISMIAKMPSITPRPHRSPNPKCLHSYPRCRRLSRTSSRRRRMQRLTLLHLQSLNRIHPAPFCKPCHRTRFTVHKRISAAWLSQPQPQPQQSY